MEIDDPLVNRLCAILLIAGMALIAYSLFFGGSAQTTIAGASATTRSASATASASAANMPSDFTPPSDMGMMGGMGMPPG